MATSNSAKLIATVLVRLLLSRHTWAGGRDLQEMVTGITGYAIPPNTSNIELSPELYEAVLTYCPKPRSSREMFLLHCFLTNIARSTKPEVQVIILELLAENPKYPKQIKMFDLRMSMTNELPQHT